MYTFKTSKDALTWSDVATSRFKSGGGDHCRQRLQKFLADLIIARKTQRWPVEYIYPQF